MSLKSSAHNKILSTDFDQLCTGIKLYPEAEYGSFGKLLILYERLLEYLNELKIAYPDFNIISVLLPWLVVLFTMQTKLGSKINILVERLTDVWEGNSSLKDQKQESVKVRQPFSNMHQPSQADTLGNVPSVPPTLGLDTSSTAISNLPTPPQVSQNTNAMYQGPNTPLPGAATPNMGPQEPMAANKAFGGMFGGF